LMTLACVNFFGKFYFQDNSNCPKIVNEPVEASLGMKKYGKMFLFLRQ